MIDSESFQENFSVCIWKPQDTGNYLTINTPCGHILRYEYDFQAKRCPMCHRKIFLIHTESFPRIPQELLTDEGFRAAFIDFLMYIHSIGMTFRDISDICGVSYQCVFSWRKKLGPTPHLTTVLKLTEFLGLSIYDIFEISKCQKKGIVFTGKTTSGDENDRHE